MGTSKIFWLLHCFSYVGYLLRSNSEIDNVFYKKEVHSFYGRRMVQLGGYINSQNSKIWSAENPSALHGNSLELSEIGVWSTVS
jgi:hypothetical protein